MCTIGEDDFGDEGAAHAMVPESSDSGPIMGGTCTKCGVESEFVYQLKFRTAECKGCFLSYARHKFRANLGASKALPKNAEVLLVVDGSAESLVLLDMLHYAQTQNTFKRLHCNARVLIIDERALREQPDDDKSLFAILQELRIRYIPFEFYVIQLGSSLNDLQKLDEYVPKYGTNELCSTLVKLRSLTARQDYLHQQRKIFIASVAHKLNCGHVFEPSISTTLATQLLTAIALGRGGSAALDVGLQDDRLHSGVKLLRPLKDLNEQEVQFYVDAQKLKPFMSAQQYGVKCGKGASLQNLTHAFVANLQQNYASTVSTVFRTGDKIAQNQQLPQALTKLELGKSDAPSMPFVCVHCLSPLDCALSDTLLAIEYSRAVSKAGTKCFAADELETKAKQQLTVERTLCHACRNIQAEFSDDSRL
ncbi:cytoplasmic tRNA 2-thiolation protein 2 [Scaptodrosophila lebanonensis]|uniref:Cytoplasmic tRNA 2-thiolation protein 2 n=1 Tax=Drosophila lebanonensis TaxID=7225 RepID=A0A6J2TMI7_DROLE|nr:cytoplasmic tRNA 2-thiolation protein 2 [Scaptodrosophila lebanonensis]